MTAVDEVEGGASPEPELPARPELSLPTNERFLLLRAEAKRNGTLADLQKLVAAWQAVAAKCDLAFEELTRLAIYRLEVERDLGAHLAQEVQHGGDRSRYARRTLLPDDITKNQSSAYQKLAAVPEDVFRAYLDAAREKHVQLARSGLVEHLFMPGTCDTAAGLLHSKIAASSSDANKETHDHRADNRSCGPGQPRADDSLHTMDCIVGQQRHIRLRDPSSGWRYRGFDGVSLYQEQRGY